MIAEIGAGRAWSALSRCVGGDDGDQEGEDEGDDDHDGKEVPTEYTEYAEKMQGRAVSFSVFSVFCGQ